MQKGKEPEYLDYNIKGRGFFDRMPYNAGAFYITGEKEMTAKVLAAVTGGSWRMVFRFSRQGHALFFLSPLPAARIKAVDAKIVFSSAL